MVGFDSPEDAAIARVKPRDCRVAATRVDGDDAFVILDLDPSGQPYLWGFCCTRRNGSWYAGQGSDRGSMSTESSVGLTVAAWGEVPTGTDMVRLEFKGQIIEEPVKQGAYVAVWWRQPQLEHGEPFPAVTAIRLNDQWVATTNWRLINQVAWEKLAAFGLPESMTILDSLAWHVMDAMADDWESIVQIEPHVHSFHGSTPPGAILQTLRSLHERHFVEAMTENGRSAIRTCTPEADWFKMTRMGRIIWETNGTRYRGEE